MKVSRWRALLRELASEPLSLAGAVVVGLFLVVAVAAPVLAPDDPIKVDVLARLAGPSRHHLLGTDALGRDLLSRLVFGARSSLGGAIAVSVAVSVIGLMVGAACGYVGGWLDTVVMRVVDALLAFPALLLALAIVGVVGPGLRSVLGGLVAVGWAGYARVVRSQVLAVRGQEFIESARAAGGSTWHIVTRHVLPHVMSPVVVLATLEIGQLILALAGLSFLGLGAQPPTPEWGAMLNDGRVFLLTAPQLMILPGIAISLVVTGFNLLGDGFRDALDPHGRRTSYHPAPTAPPARG